MVLTQLLGAFSANEAKFRKRSQWQKINDSTLEDEQDVWMPPHSL
jgi:hypothetical protein